MNYIFIDSQEEITKVGIIEEDRLVEFYMEENKREKLVGNIYRGRVNNVLPGMEAAFIEIGEGKNAYLYIKDAMTREMIMDDKHYTISDIVKGGEEIIVQVIKEPLGNKGPKVSARLSIPGRYIVFTPFNSRISVSRRIDNSLETKRLKAIGKKIVKDNMGLILRTRAEGIDELEIQKEYDELLNIYKKIEREKNFLPCPKLLYKELDLGYQIIRDSINDRTEKIIVNNKEIYDNILLMGDHFPLSILDKLILDKGFSMESNPIIEKDIKEALERKVSLGKSGYIVIDETEALTSIDVNTGKYVGDYSLEKTVVHTNLVAAEEIARQIRLRDIGGIIIVDFIHMSDKNDISLVLGKLEECLLRDKNRTNVVGITKLGLVEMTRKKIRRTLDAKFSKECPECHGKGRIMNKIH